MVQHAKEIAPKPTEEPKVPTEFTVSREEVPTTEQPELEEQRHAAKLQPKEQTGPGQSDVHITRVVTEAESVHLGEPSSPKGDIQGPSVPSGEEILEKALDEIALHELSLNVQQTEDVEIQSAEPQPVCGEP